MCPIYRIPAGPGKFYIYVFTIHIAEKLYFIYMYSYSRKALFEVEKKSVKNISEMESAQAK